MANSFATDPHCISLWQFEPGALYDDSVGVDTLTADSLGTPVVESITTAGLFQEGSGSGKTNYTDADNYAYFTVGRYDLSSGFPLKSGDSDKLMSAAGWFRLTNASYADYVFANPFGGNRAFALTANASTDQYQLRIYYSGASFITVTMSSAGLALNQWIHFGLAIDGVNKTYLLRTYNASTAAAQTFSGALSQAPQELTAGIQIGSYGMYADEFVVFDTLKTAGEFDAIRGGVYVPTATGLLDGKVLINWGVPVTNTLDGKAVVYADANTDTLDGSIEVITTGTNLLDGLAVLAGEGFDVLDGLLDLPLMVRAESWAWLDIAPASQWALPSAIPRREIFVCVLRLSPLADIEMPMASMQLRRRDGNPTMVSCVVPDAMTYYAAAVARDGGEIIIYAGSETEDGTRHLSELERATLDSISYDRGVESSSLSLSGYRTASTANPRPVDLEGISYYGVQADGKQRVRSKVNIFLRPGDTAIFQGGSFVVDQIYIAVDPKNAWMEAAGQ